MFVTAVELSLLSQTHARGGCYALSFYFFPVLSSLWIKLILKQTDRKFNYISDKYILLIIKMFF